MPKPVRILIVDDSAFARKVVREILSAIPWIEVIGAARDGEEALAMTSSLMPDLVICDLQMPRVNGVDFVRRQMALRRLPILILSAAPQDGPEVVEALGAGAIDVVQKPTTLATDDLRSVGEALVEKVRQAMDVTWLNPARAPGPSPAEVQRVHPCRADVVVMGISTGGPQALRAMLPLLPADLRVPVAIVLHMPIGYTALYAEKLNELCDIDVKESEDGDVLRPGLVLLAAAGRHLTLRHGSDREVVARHSLHPLEKIHRPSADVLFQSAAETFGDRVLAVVMTGMGDDGKEGAAWIKAKGGTVITEAEETCVVYGMPRSIVDAGLSDMVVPLDKMAHAITSNL